MKRFLVVLLIPAFLLGCHVHTYTHPASADGVVYKGPIRRAGGWMMYRAPLHQQPRWAWPAYEHAPQYILYRCELGCSPGWCLHTEVEVGPGEKYKPTLEKNHGPGREDR